MVWGLFHVDPLSGEDKYYFFSKGTYKVGRKGCDVIINKDKGVSRIHAEIVIDAMTSADHLLKKSSDSCSKVRVRDCSKYGTFINKNMGLTEKVHDLPNKETTMKDGDLVSFGTGNATYRFCFVPLMFFLCSMEHSQVNRLLQDKISSIGASITHKWSSECTHALVDDFVPLKEDAIHAIVARKPLVRFDWVEFIAEKNICTEIPGCSSYAPTLMLKGVSVKVTDPKSRENCLRGYTFCLESTKKYKFKDNLQALLEVGGAKVVLIEGFCPSSQGLEDEGNDHVVRVIPAGLANSAECQRNLSSLSRVNEIDLIAAILSGHLDTSVIVLAPVVVTSSCSTDETVVADSDVDMETVTSVHTSAAVHAVESVERDSEGKIPIHTIESSQHDSRGEVAIHMKESSEHESKGVTAVHTMESSEHEGKVETSTLHGADSRLESGEVTYLRGRSDGIMAIKEKIDDAESGNIDIIYSQDLIVRDTNLPASVHSSMKGAVLDFKRFRKTSTQSGNSFNNLIPFSKYPYKDSDNGREEVVEYVKEEKKRKQMEAVAEDLFNNEGRRRGAAGSLHGLLARG